MKWEPTPDWMAGAACANAGPDLWFAPEHPRGPLTSEQIRNDRARVVAAKAVCRACPAQSDCLTHALRHDIRWGIWGGLTVDERKKARTA